MTLNLRLSVKQYDRVYALASRERCSVPEAIRRALQVWLRRQDDHGRTA
jgi:hypothetical protein